MRYPYHPPWFDHHNNIWRTYKLWSSSICNFLHPPLPFSFLSPNNLYNTLLSNTHSKFSSLGATAQVLHAHKSIGNLAVLCNLILYVYRQEVGPLNRSPSTFLSIQFSPPHLISYDATELIAQVVTFHTCGMGSNLNWNRDYVEILRGFYHFKKNTRIIRQVKLWILPHSSFKIH
jgi:hypothetical protein